MLFNLKRKANGSFGVFSPSSGIWEDQSYFNWDDTQPDPAADNENCAAFWTDSRLNKWHDIYCDPAVVKNVACLEIKPPETGSGGGGK